MSSKSKTKSSSVTTPTNPAWVTSGAQDLASQISGLTGPDWAQYRQDYPDAGQYAQDAVSQGIYGSLDDATQHVYDAYGKNGGAVLNQGRTPESYIAGADPLQTQAATAAAGLGTDRSWLDNILNAKPQQVQSASVLDGLSNYMSPYTNDVVNTSLADFDQNAGATRAAQTLQMAGSGAFGGSGQSLTRSATEDSLARARASLDAGLRDQAFNTGAGLSNSDAARRQDASGQNANLYQQMLALQGQTGLAGEQSQRANIALQGDLGEQMRAIQQAKLGAPISMLGTQTGLFGQLPLNLFNGQNTNSTSTTTTSDPMKTIGWLAMMAAAPFTGGASLAGLGGLGAMFGGAGAGALANNAASLAGSGLAGWGS